MRRHLSRSQAKVTGIIFKILFLVGYLAFVYKGFGILANSDHSYLVILGYVLVLVAVILPTFFLVFIRIYNKMKKRSV